MEDDINQFRAVFFEEAAERLIELEQNVLRLESDSSEAVVGAIFRAAHSLKGASGSFGFEDIETFTHTLESVLDKVRSGGVPVTPELVGVVLRAVDVLKQLVAVAQGRAQPARHMPDVIAELTAFLSAPREAAMPDGFELFDAPAAAPAQAASTVPDPALPAAAEPSPSTPQEHGVDVSTLRVSAAKLDMLVDLVGELVIAQSMLNEVLRREGMGASHHVREAASHVERTMRDLQEHCMGVRMLPVSVVLQRFPRLVRDLAASSGKKITLQLDGDQTELDKSLVERLVDPLTHLVRNAIDHGIEPPAERAAAGKDEVGVIRVAAKAQGGSVFIEVRDDGRGIDHEKVRRVAVERGLLEAHEQPSYHELEQLIFAPGFSTASAVSTISGRGVGMDVVKSAVESLGGSVAIFSESGKGTMTRLKLPLTLAMLSGMSLSVGAQTYVLPVLSIVESLRPRREDVKPVLGRGDMLMLRGEVLPILRLHQIFAQAPRSTDPCEAILVVIENEGRRVALQVDDLLGEQQVVVKSLDTNFQRVDGIMGATVMGDGRVALILDAPSLVRGRAEA